MIPYKQRTEKLEKPSSLGADRWYSYLINEWIPRQPDALELMGLFIDCDFDPKTFVDVLVSEPVTQPG